MKLFTSALAIAASAALVAGIDDAGRIEGIEKMSTEHLVHQITDAPVDKI